MSYTQAWLEDSRRARGILVIAKAYNVVTTVTDTFYFSTMGFITTDASISFNPIISKSLQLTESITLDGSASISFGDIELNNPNGQFDSWLDSSFYIWVNNSIKVYFGDPTWVCANEAEIITKFDKVFDGVIADVDSRNRTTINIKVRDKLDRLNTALSEDKLGPSGFWSGGQTNQESIKPIVFGDVHNMEPLLINPATLEYMFNNGPAENLIEIRDNGVSVYTFDGVTAGAVVNLSAGTFTLTAAPAGLITASVQGVQRSVNLSTGVAAVGTFSNNIANIIALIVTEYGKTSTSSGKFLGSTELDLTGLAAFASANLQSIGVLIKDRDNLLSIIQGIAASIGAHVTVTRAGLLTLIKLFTNTAAAVSITDSDILEHSLSISNRTEVVATTKVAYAKNWTPQTGIVTDIVQASKEAFGSEWLYQSITDSLVKNRYSLETEPTPKETFLVDTADAIAEAQRLNNLFKVPHTVYKFTGTAKLLSLKLGQGVRLYHNRFGLSAGKAGQVISLSPDWSTSLIDIEVIV